MFYGPGTGRSALLTNMYAFAGPETVMLDSSEEISMTSGGGLGGGDSDARSKMPSFSA